MKEFKAVLILILVISVLALLMRYKSSETEIDVVSKERIEKLRDSLIVSNEESKKLIDSLDVEINKKSDSINNILSVDSSLIIERSKIYEEISNSDIDGLYTDIKLYLDSIEIPKQ